MLLVEMQFCFIRQWIALAGPYAYLIKYRPGWSLAIANADNFLILHLARLARWEFNLG